MIKGIVPTTASICTGVGGLSLGFERAGFLPLWFCEIDRQCREVLRKHWATTPIYHDMLGLDLENIKRPDVLEISAPCQAFSCAGLRGSLDDPRGNLTLASIKIAHALNPKFIISENVPGILSTADNAFGCFIAGMVGCDSLLVPPRTIPRWKRGKSGEYFSWPNSGMVVGPKRCCAWAVLNSEFFGVAQRRSRVFAVFDSGDGSCARVLFESASGSRNHPQSRGAGEDASTETEGGSGSGGDGGLRVANSLRGQGPGTGRIGDSRGNDNVVLQQHATNDNIAHCVAAHAAKSGDLTTDNYVISTFQNTGHGWWNESDTAQTIRTPDGGGSMEANVVAFRTSSNCGPFDQGDKTAALNTATDPNQNTVASPRMGCRRLTPTESERLQGFPDGWTKLAISEKTGEVYEQCDAPRYRQMGNAVTVNVAEWIARRIKPFIK